MSFIRYTNAQWVYIGHIKSVSAVPVFIRKRRLLADRPF